MTREALKDCDDTALDKVEAVADAIGGLCASFVPSKAIKAQMLVGLLRQCVGDERTRRKEENPAPDNSDAGPNPKR
jgi:hypothetical protein